MTASGSELASRLRAVVGESHVLTDPALQQAYVRDWTGRWTGSCALVVRPGDVQQAADVLAVVSAVSARVVLQGGNTGLVAGAVPEAGDVLLSTTRLSRIGAVDPVAAVVTAEAGVTLTALQDAVRPAGLELAVDLAARESCTLGGMAATNAGGIRTLSDGSMRSQVVAVDALDVRGRPLTRMRPLVKDNTGFGMSSLLVGSEGTLGLVTRLLLRLVPMPASRAVVLLGLPDVPAAVAALGALRPRLPGLRAAELVDRPCLELVLAQTGLSDPLPRRHDAHLLLELAGAPGRLAELADALEVTGLTDDPSVDIAAADDVAGVRALWAYRDRITESVGAAGVPHKLDVSLPAARTAEFVDRCLALLERWPRPVVGALRPFLFGHLGDGNLHLNILGADVDDDALDGAVLQLVAEHGGSISAEHGIGRSKAAWLPLNRDPDEIAAMTALKRALDPEGRLGRAVLPVAGGAPPAGSRTR